MLLDREGIRTALMALDVELGRSGVRGELFVVGGAAMAMAYDARRATVDVDATFLPASEVRKAARRVAEDLGLEPDWLNDGAKAFMPGNDPDQISVFEGNNLSVAAASPRYLLAMKLLAARVDRDQDDISSALCALWIHAGRRRAASFGDHLSESCDRASGPVLAPGDVPVEGPRGSRARPITDLQGPAERRWRPALRPGQTSGAGPQGRC
jgi:hypothetical protein